MAIRRYLAVALAGACLVTGGAGANAQPARITCTAAFKQSDLVGAFVSADLTDSVLDRLYVEMGPVRVAMTVKGPGVSGAYTAKAPELAIWNYMSIYQPAKEWLTAGSVRLDYSGFRVGWPEFRSNGKVVKALKLTVSQGTQSVTVDVGATRNRVFAIDFEAMLPGPHPVQRVDDHVAWRQMAEAGHPISVTLTDASNAKVVARAQASDVPTDMQSLLSGGLNALRDKFKAGGCK